jgi:hypothetical protein
MFSCKYEIKLGNIVQKLDIGLGQRAGIGRLVGQIQYMHFSGTHRWFFGKLGD